MKVNGENPSGGEILEPPPCIGVVNNYSGGVRKSPLDFTIWGIHHWNLLPSCFGVDSYGLCGDGGSSSPMTCDDGGDGSYLIQV